MNEQAQGGEETAKPHEYWPEGTGAGQALSMMLAPQLVFLLLAFWASAQLGVEPLGRFALDAEAALLGAVVALALGLLIFGSRAALPAIWETLEDRAIKMFAEAPFRLTWGLVILLSLVAGIFEEIVFRGALQGWLETVVPLWAAIALQAAVFAALHPLSRAYVVYVFLIGAALGAVYAWSGNLLVVIVAHVLYDIYALGRVRRLAMDRADRIAPAA